MTGKLYVLFHNIRYFLLIIPDWEAEPVENDALIGKNRQK